MSMQDVLFYLFGGMAIAASFGVATSRNPLKGAVFLLLSLFSVAGLFAWAGAHFLAAMQVLVYAGAVAVLFIFVIMLLNLSEKELGGSLDMGMPQLAGLLFVVIALAAIFSVAIVPTGSFSPLTGDGPGAVKNVGDSLLTRFVAPFEVISLLLLAAMSGAVMLTKRAHAGEAALDAINRVRAVIDRRTSRAFVPDPNLPSQSGPPARQAPPPADTPDVGVDRGVMAPGETV